MLLHRLQAHRDLLARKRLAGSLDIRTPEDLPVIERENMPAAPIRSPAIDKALGDFGAAMHSGMLDEMKRAAKSVVDATSAYYRISGVPVFAHEPVPWQLIKEVLPVEQLTPGEHTKQAVGRFVDLFHDSVKPMLMDQLMRQLNGGGQQFGPDRDGPPFNAESNLGVTEGGARTVPLSHAKYESLVDELGYEAKSGEQNDTAKEYLAAENKEKKSERYRTGEIIARLPDQDGDGEYIFIIEIYEPHVFKGKIPEEIKNHPKAIHMDDGSVVLPKGRYHLPARDDDRDGRPDGMSIAPIGGPMSGRDDGRRNA